MRISAPQQEDYPARQGSGVWSRVTVTLAAPQVAGVDRPRLGSSCSVPWRSEGVRYLLGHRTRPRKQ